MSQLVAPSHTAADSMPLGRRITEIMLEKGSAYTISAMAKRLEINRETYRLMLKGEREIYTFELEKIAADLKVPVERILQQDTATLKTELVELLNVISSDFHQGLKMAQQLADVAIGSTERASAANLIGIACYHLRESEKALEVFQGGLPDAKLGMDKYDDAELYFSMIGNIINIRTALKDYQGIQDLLISVESHFEQNARISAIFCYNWALLLEEWKDDHEGARQRHYQSLAYYEQTGIEISVGRSKHLVAMFEYRQKNYDKAIALYQEALEIFRHQNHLYFRIIIGRDFGRALLRTGQAQAAVEVITESLAQITSRDYVDLEAQLNLLLSIATDQPEHAERIITHQLSSISMQKLAGKFLVEYAERRGDLDAVLEAERRLEEMLGSPIDLLLPIKSTVPHFILTLLDLCILNMWQLTAT